MSTCGARSRRAVSCRLFVGSSGYNLGVRSLSDWKYVSAGGESITKVSEYGYTTYLSSDNMGSLLVRDEDLLGAEAIRLPSSKCSEIENEDCRSIESVEVDILEKCICEVPPIDWKESEGFGCCSSVASLWFLLKRSPPNTSLKAQSIPSTNCEFGVRNSVPRSDGSSSTRKVEDSIEAKLLVLPRVSDNGTGKRFCDVGE